MIYSDLTAKDFNNPDVLLGSLWHFDRMDKTNGHENNYHGQFVPQVAQQLIKRYTKPGDTIVDWFMGSGTSIIEAIAMKRRAIGVDLKQDMWPYVIEKTARLKTSEQSDYVLLQADSTLPGTRSNVIELMNGNLAQLCILHPPYHNIIRFSDDPYDLSNQSSCAKFLTAFERVALNAWVVLEPGRFAAVVIGDIYEDGQTIPLGFKCMRVMQSNLFNLKSIIVKNIAGNERGKGKNAAIWRYRALQGNFSIFEHEYIFIFQKPAEKRKNDKRRSEDKETRRTHVGDKNGVQD